MKSSTNSARPSHSLSTTIALTFFALSVIVSVLSGGLVLLSYVRTQQEAVAGNLHAVAQGAANQVSEFFQDKFGALETLSTLSHLTPEYRAQNTQNLENLLNIQPSFRQLAILTLDGQVIADSSSRTFLSIRELAKRLTPAMKAQLQAGERASSPVYIDSAMKEPLILLATPVKDETGAVQGALLAELNLKPVWDLVAQLQVGATGIAYAVDRAGNLVAYQDTARVLDGANVQNLDSVRAFASRAPAPNSNSLNLETGIRNDTVVSSTAALGAPDWAIMAELPWLEAYSNVLGIVISSALIILVISLLAGLVGLYLARRLTAQLVSLTQTATRITAGELNVQAKVEGPTEISGLALAFNNMTTRLRQTLAELEQRVTDRTRALETSRNELENANLDLQSNRAYLEALNETSANLMGRLNTKELLQAIVTRAATLVHTDNGYIYLQDDPDLEMMLRVGIGLYEGLVGAQAKRDVGLAGTVWANGQALVVNDYRNWPGRLGGVGRQDIQAAVGVPLRAGDKVIGVIGLAYGEPGRKFEETEIEILNRFAQLASIALENARLFEQSQAALAQSEQQALMLRRLSATSAEVSLARNFDQVMSISQQAIHEVLAPERTAVLLKTPDGAHYRVYAVQGEGGELAHGAVLPLAATLLQDALTKRRLEYAPDIIAHYNNPDAMAGVVRGFRAVINAPLVVDNVAIGALNVSSKTLNRFSAQSVDFVKQIVALASGSLQKMRLLEQTQSALSEAEGLYRATRELGNASDLAGLLRVAAEFGRAQGFDRATLALEDPMQDPQAPRFVIHSATCRGQTIAIEPPTAANDLWAISDDAYRTAEGQKLLVLPELAKATHLSETTRQTLQAQKIHALASVMLRLGDGQAGYLTITSSEPLHLQIEALERQIVAFGNQFGTALENRRLYEQTQTALAEAQRAVEREREATEQVLALNRRLTREGWQEYLDAQAEGLWVEDAIPEMQSGGAALPELEHAAETGELVISRENGHSALAMPIVVRGQVIGTLGLEDADGTQEWSADRIGIINDVAQTLGMALDNARLYDESQRRVTELGALNRISQAVTSELDLASLLNIIGEQVRQIFDVQSTYIALYDRANETIALPYFVNDNKRVQVEPIRFGEGLTSQIIRTRQPLVLNETLDDTMAQLGAKVFGAPAQAYLGVPILLGDEVTGVISIQSALRGHAFGEGNVRLLETIAAAVGAAIQNAQLYGAMEQEVQERKRAEEEIKLSLKEKEVLLKEIHHRVKNNLQIITSLLNLQSAQIKEPETLAMFRESQARVRSMALIHEKLYQSKDLARIDFSGYVRELMVYLFRSYTVSPDQIQTEFEMGEIYLGIDTAIPCGLIISELVTNSMKYAFPNGRRGKLAIALHPHDDGNLVLRIADNGVGFPDDFDWRESDSLGLQLVSTLTSQLHGKMEVSGRDGACFTLTFPE